MLYRRNVEVIAQLLSQAGACFGQRMVHRHLLISQTGYVFAFHAPNARTPSTAPKALTFPPRCRIAFALTDRPLPETYAIVNSQVVTLIYLLPLYSQNRSTNHRVTRMAQPKFKVGDRVKWDKLTKNDPQAQGQHHYIPLDMVASVEQDAVRLNLSAEQARQQVMGGGSMGRAGGSM